MAVEQMNISMPPKMAKFVHSKVKAGSFTNASEVVRTALRRMQDEEAREEQEEQVARAAADDILAGLTRDNRDEITAQVRAGLASIERGEYTDYMGREGLGQPAAEVKARGRKRLAHTQLST